MEMASLIRRTIDFQQSMSRNTFEMMTVLWDQMAKMVDTSLANAAWFPDEGKRAVSESMGVYRKGFEDFKAIVDNNFQNLRCGIGRPEQKQAGPKEHTIPIIETT